MILPPGKKVFTIRQKIEAPNFYTYEARFVPDRPEDDAMPQNNRATAFTHVQGKGQVLLIEDAEHPGEFAVLVERLRQQGLEVDVQSSSQLFTTLAELQPYDTVVLANVPREQFSDGQIAMLVRNTQQMGAGLVMLGGPNSFGAGGWTDTEVEKAMPVDFQIKIAKVVPRGALVMIMHASEMAEGNYWQKVIAREAIKALGPQDYCGVIHWQRPGSSGSGGRACCRSGQPRSDAGPARPHDARRHARLRSGHGPGQAGLRQAARRGRQAHDHHQRRRSFARPARTIINALKTMSVTISTVARRSARSARKFALSAASPRPRAESITR